MFESTRFVGLDVHAASISVAFAEASSEAKYVTKIPNDLGRVLKSLDRLGPRESLRVAYEAGPTGYGLCRALGARTAERLASDKGLGLVRVDLLLERVRLARDRGEHREGRKLLIEASALVQRTGYGIRHRDLTRLERALTAVANGGGDR